MDLERCRIFQSTFRPTRVIFWRENNEETNIMVSHINLYKELDEEGVEEEFMEEKNFTREGFY